MNFIKATIATAAVITCCLGNDYPAKAELSRNEVKAFQRGHHTGYALGLVASGCISYVDGSISRSKYRQIIDIASTLDETTQAIRDYVVRNMGDEAHSSPYRRCAPIVKQVMSRPSAYRNADNWR